MQATTTPAYSSPGQEPTFTSAAAVTLDSQLNNLALSSGPAIFLRLFTETVGAFTHNRCSRGSFDRCSVNASLRLNLLARRDAESRGLRDRVLFGPVSQNDEKSEFPEVGSGSWAVILGAVGAHSTLGISNEEGGTAYWARQYWDWWGTERRTVGFIKSNLRTPSQVLSKYERKLYEDPVNQAAWDRRGYLVRADEVPYLNDRINALRLAWVRHEDLLCHLDPYKYGQFCPGGEAALHYASGAPQAAPLVVPPTQAAPLVVPPTGAERREQGLQQTAIAARQSKPQAPALASVPLVAQQQHVTAPVTGGVVSMLPEETRRAVLSNPALQSVVRMLLAAIDRQVGVVTDPAQQSAALDLSIILALYIAKERGWTAFGTLRGGPVVIN